MLGAGTLVAGLHPGLLAQILEPDPIPLGNRMAGGKGEVEGVVEKRETAQPRLESLADARELEKEDEVELPGSQAGSYLLRLALGKGDLDPGVGGAEAGDRGRHQGRAGGREGGGANAAAATGGDGADLLFRGLDLGQDAADVTGERGARRSRPGAASPPLDQLRPHLLLEGRDRL